MISGLMILVIIGLVKFSNHYDEMTCASIWAGLRFLTGLLSLSSFIHNLFWSTVGFGVAYVFFYFLRREKDFSIKWITILVLGTAGLIYL